MCSATLRQYRRGSDCAAPRVLTARTSRFARPETTAVLPSFAHALAEALDQPQGARGPAVTVAGDDVLDPLLDRIDQGCSLGAYHQHEFIEPLEPRHLQELVARHVEDEGGDADAEELCKHDREYGAHPMF